MTESSYIPMNDLKNGLRSPRASHPMKNALLDSELSLEYDDSPAGDGRVAESLTPLRPLQPQIYHQRHSLNVTKAFCLSFYHACKSLLFPMVAIGYLAFCYTVHNHNVPLDTYGLIDTTPVNLIAIKGTITTISIVIIKIALYPLNSMLSDLRSEEFFRVLSSRPHGVSLSTANSMSSPSFGYIDAIKAMIGRNCSRYFVACVTASIMVLVASTLAPATLSIQSVLADGDIMAFAVAAVPAQSVWNGSTKYLNSSGLYAFENSRVAAYLLWAEMALGAQYSFSAANSPDPDIAAYIVPAPLDLSTTTSSRWLTDVIGINPSCAWSSTNITGTVDMSSDDTEVLLGVNLQDADLDVSIIAGAPTSYVFIIDPTTSVFNHSTQEPPTDGSTVFQLGQCVAGCDMRLSGASYVWLNFTGLPTFRQQQDGMFHDVAILVCKPNAQITTREVRNNGFGMLSVQPSPNGVNYKPQGNLHPGQTPALFSFAMAGFATNAGPFIDHTHNFYGGLGTDVQQYFLFGREEVDNLPTSAGSIVNLTVLPTANLSSTFATMLQSSSKAYLTGYLGRAYVPGRLSTPEVVFASSMPHLAISTAMFMLLFIMTVVAHFRRGKGGKLTLINIGAALCGSELPAQISQMKAGSSEESRPLLDKKSVQEDLADMIGDRNIFMQKRADGSDVLHIT